MRIVQLLLMSLLFASTSIQAQVSINVNFGTPPEWAPRERVEVQYYYLPDIDCYYDVPSASFIYIKNGRWIRATNLPYRYRNYNLRGGNVIFLTDYRGSAPYNFHNQHRQKYVHKTVVYKPKKTKNHQNGNGNNHNPGNKKGKKH